MNLLALDTSSVACTVALEFDGVTTTRHEERPREHTRLLVPMIRDLLRESKTELADLDAIVLGNGPGSFIGMRIAASVAQGLAFGACLKIIPISSLAAVAAQVFFESDADEVAVAQDAHMDEVYFGHYARSENDMPRLMADETLHACGRIAGIDTSSSMRRVAAGYGWHRYPTLTVENMPLFRDVSDVYYPQAKYLLPLAASGVGVAPQNIDPAYLRREVAQKPPAPKR